MSFAVERMRIQVEAWLSVGGRVQVEAWLGSGFRLMMGECKGSQLGVRESEGVGVNGLFMQVRDSMYA